MQNNTNEVNTPVERYLTKEEIGILYIGRINMSEPDVDWYIHRIKVMLGEIDKLVFEDTMTNSKREIISYNTNEIEINLHTIIRKLKNDAKSN